jgi:hypothetical protein
LTKVQKHQKACKKAPKGKEPEGKGDRTRGSKKSAAINKSLDDTSSEQKGQIDALRQQVADLRDEQKPKCDDTGKTTGNDVRNSIDIRNEVYLGKVPFATVFKTLLGEHIELCIADCKTALGNFGAEVKKLASDVYDSVEYLAANVQMADDFARQTQPVYSSNLRVCVREYRDIDDPSLDVCVVEFGNTDIPYDPYGDNETVEQIDGDKTRHSLVAETTIKDAWQAHLMLDDAPSTMDVCAVLGFEEMLWACFDTDPDQWAINVANAKFQTRIELDEKVLVFLQYALSVGSSQVRRGIFQLLKTYKDSVKPNISKPDVAPFLKACLNLLQSSVQFASPKFWWDYFVLQANFESADLRAYSNVSDAPIPDTRPAMVRKHNGMIEGHMVRLDPFVRLRFNQSPLLFEDHNHDTVVVAKGSLPHLASERNTMSLLNEFRPLYITDTVLQECNTAGLLYSNEEGVQLKNQVSATLRGSKGTELSLVSRMSRQDVAGDSMIVLGIMFEDAADTTIIHRNSNPLK